MISIGDRVRVAISDTSRYACGCASKLDGKEGTITAHNPMSQNGHGDNGRPPGPPGPAWLVEFDIPAEPWTSYSEPYPCFWFPRCDIEAIEG